MQLILTIIIDVNYDNISRKCGTTADPGSVSPWQVRLKPQVDNRWCGGVLVKPNIALTTASCLGEEVNETKQLGCLQLRNAGILGH